MINFPRYYRMSDVICIYFIERASLNEYLFYETYLTYVARQIYYRYLWNHFGSSLSHFLLEGTEESFDDSPIGYQFDIIML